MCELTMLATRPVSRSTSRSRNTVTILLMPIPPTKLGSCDWLSDRSPIDKLRNSRCQRAVAWARSSNLGTRLMDARRPTIDPQLVYLDPFLVDRARVSLGLAVKHLAVEADVAY